MIASEFCYEFKLKLKNIQVKLLSANYFRVFFEDLPVLYGNDINKIKFHIDKISNHTFK